MLLIMSFVHAEDLEIVRTEAAVIAAPVSAQLLALQEARMDVT